MRFALVNNKRIEAFPAGIATCPTCGEDVIAKCGTRIIHHWAHKSRKDCDSWSEPETPWHRAWKSNYPEACQEIQHVDAYGEVHRADIKTPSGIYIEVQHSPISDQERISREKFYQNLVWIVDGTVFQNNFQIHHMLPSPDSTLAQDLVWAQAQNNTDGANSGLFFRLSECQEDNPDITKSEVRGGWIHSIQEIRDALEDSYDGHHQYVWIRPRKTWLDATCPVYIDFGTEFLVRLKIYDDSNLPCIQYVHKKKFLYDSNNESLAINIATRFHPIP